MFDRTSEGKADYLISEFNEGMLIRDFLRKEQSFSRRMLKAIIYDGGKILVNGQQRTMRYSLKLGDVLTIHFPTEKKGARMLAEEIPLDIIYEDQAILVISKQAGIATIPSSHHPTGTIANGILYYYEKNDISSTVHVVTRLDRDTSGLMLIAKNRYVHSLLAASQKNGEVKRNYYGIVKGIPGSGTIDANIGRKEGSIIERMVREDGQRAITHYQFTETNGIYSLVDIVLVTGRTHQIRVHLSHIGYPLAGDDLYGGSTEQISRQALHCHRLEFNHPITNENVTFINTIPKDMEKVISQQFD